MTSPNSRNDQPLGLTVHSQPAPGEIAGVVATQTRIGRWKMLLLALLCAAPVIASYFTYYVVRPEGRRNYGTLIEPQRPLPAMQATGLDGGVIQMPSLRGQWLLVSVAGGACGEPCAEHLYMQRQLRTGLGKEKERVDWVWLVNDDAPVPAEILPALKDATVLRLPQAQLQQWLEAESGQDISAHLYVVDPIGNWMMRFPADLQKEDAPKVKRDLERLLRASAFWDQPGR